MKGRYLLSNKEFYTSYSRYGNEILLRYVDENGVRKMDRVKNFAPDIFVKSKPSGGIVEARTIYGEPLARIPTKDMRDAKDTKEQFNGVEGMQIFGYSKYENQYIAKRYNADQVASVWSVDLISLCYLDIETDVEHGFPDPIKCQEEVNIITFYDTNSKKWYCFGRGEFIPRRRKKDEKGEYLVGDDGQPVWEEIENAYKFSFDNELDLIKAFIQVFERVKPDVITGWNVETFDIAYLFNRIMRLLGEDHLKRLSPWGRVNSRTVNTMYGEALIFDPVGISVLDMRDLYKKLVRDPRDNYKLDHIAEVDLGDEKLKHPSGVPGHLLYKSDFQAAMDYNIHDVQLLIDLEEKRKIIQTVLVIAYSSLTNFTDVLSQTRVWDNILYLDQLEKGVQFELSVPPKIKTPYEGGYVKPPLVGKYKWVVSFDVTSEYPSLIMALNISPEKLLSSVSFRGVDLHLNGASNSEALKLNATFAANGTMYDRANVGFMPAITKKLFDERSMYKKRMIKAKQAAEKESDPSEKKKLKDEAQRWDLLQNARKVQLNSLYGAMGCEYFRFFDVRMAEAITLSGQLLIQWVARDLNLYLNRLCGTKDKDYVLAIDTDSVYVHFGEFVEKAMPNGTEDEITDALSEFCKSKVQDVINASFRRLADHFNAIGGAEFHRDVSSDINENWLPLSMKREAIATGAVFLAKKRYIMNVLDNEEVRYSKADLKIMGVEAIKSSTPGQCREWMKSIFPVFLHGDEQELQAAIGRMRTDYESLSPADIAANTSVSELEKWDAGGGAVRKGCPFNSRAAIAYNHAIKSAGLDKQYSLIRGGDKIKYVSLREPNRFGSGYFAWTDEWPAELKLDGVIDREGHFHKTLAKPMEAIAKVIGWDLTPQNRIADMF